jgi:hypothetical protein
VAAAAGDAMAIRVVANEEALAGPRALAPAGIAGAADARGLVGGLGELPAG